MVDQPGHKLGAGEVTTDDEFGTLIGRSVYFQVLALRGVRSVGTGGGHPGIHRMSLAIIALSLILSSSDSPHIPSVCFHEQRICFSCAPPHSLTLPLGSRGSAQPAWQSRSLLSGFLSLWAAEVVWLLIAVCQRDLGSQSKWPISKDEPKLIC